MKLTTHHISSAQQFDSGLQHVRLIVQLMGEKKENKAVTEFDGKQSFVSLASNAMLQIISSSLDIHHRNARVFHSGANDTCTPLEITVHSLGGSPE